MKKTYMLPLLILMSGSVSPAGWAQEKKREDVEGKVRAAGFGYFTATALGDAPGLMKVTRHPLLVIKDGLTGSRHEKGSRLLLSGIAERLKQSGTSNEQKGRLLGSMIQVFDEASVQFVGANTAHLTFVIKFGTREAGDKLNTLLLHRGPQGAWKVIGEITDSEPVPPTYLVELP